ncbi:MAG: flavin reductase family protein [Bacteroidetes bacterium]|nr:flavin reductase family protein [Bacteroidota bacterium]
MNNSESQIPELSAEVLKQLTYQFSYGVYVLTAADGELISGMTAVWVSQVSKDPVRVGIGIQPTGFTAGLIRKSGRFVVNVLSQSQQQLAYHFGTPSENPAERFEGLVTELSPSGIPVLSGTSAWMECEVEQELDLGTHVWIVGRVIHGIKPDSGLPAMYHNGKIF